jgi:SAM-dependent methyltransferase
MTLSELAKKVLRRLMKSVSEKQPDFLEQNKKKKLKECYICKEQFESFYKFHLPLSNKLAASHFQMVGSDSENFGCCYCNCNDRERHLFMYFDKLSIWDKFRDAKVLHFAPESPISNKIIQLRPSVYIKCDLYPREDWVKIDITKIDFEDNSFDILIANHILEHVPQHLLALKEISRVLKKDGFAILQTPYSELFYNHFEDKNINTNELKISFYGQDDHVRIVSKRQFFDELSHYFTLNIVKNQSLFTEEECYRFGVNMKEDLLMIFNNLENK